MTKAAKSPLSAATFLLCVLSLLASARAQTLTGTVTNGTTNKPAAGDEVILINLTTTMEVAASTKADAAGKFSFTLKDGPSNGGPHLIRAVHQGVTYHQIAPPGTSNVDLKVYDVSKKVEALGLTADVIRIQADKTTMQGIRLFAVDNNSSPPVTQMNDHNFEFYLPPGAKVLQLQARAPNGQPIAAEVSPQSEKNRYAVNFPLRPGETQFQLEFTVPYSGSAKFDIKSLYPAEHFVVVLPKAMRFTNGGAAAFKAMDDPNEPGTSVEVVQKTKAGETMAFSIAGTGTINDSAAQTAAGGGQQEPQGPEQGQATDEGPSQGASQMPQSGRDNRPGGGLGAPIDAPDPLEKYRWPIIGAFIVLLGIGGWIVTKRQTGISAASLPGGSTSRGAFSSSPLSVPITGPGSAGGVASVGSASGGSASVVPAVAAMPKSAMILEALKEELFQLEIERKQGKITPEDYEKAKAALDQTLDRALKRQG